jgi:regulator of protease activity HflC (stomatin/prohibitin superfamily)
LAAVPHQQQEDRVTVEEIQKRLDYIRKIRGDDETAHTVEDELRADVLRAIAEGRCEDPAACAAEALKSADIQFARWCA